MARVRHENVGWLKMSQVNLRDEVLAPHRVCRNFRQLASVCRSGAGGIFGALRTRRIVDALTRWPSFSSSPWIRWYPQP